jgi:hypothetical protein
VIRLPSTTISCSGSFALGLAKRVAGTGVTVNLMLLGPSLSEGATAKLQQQQDKTGQPL